MARGRKKGKKVINQLVEHIADYSDMEYDNEETAEDMVLAQVQNKNDKKCEDETDRMWMYKDIPDKEFVDEASIDENELWDDSDSQDDTETHEQKEGVLNNAVVVDSIDKYMTAAVWFHEINERGYMTELEKRYVTLMLIEMSKFYFDNLGTMNLSHKCREAINKIYMDIKEARLCSE